MPERALRPLSLLILRDAMFRQFTRFSQFQRSLAIAPNILTKRLDGFVTAGLMVRRAQPVRPEHHEYVLTEMRQSARTRREADGLVNNRFVTTFSSG